MKLNYIYDIADECAEFMNKIINEEELLDYEVLMERLSKVIHNCAEHNDDTIDIDYKDMCFTVYLDEITGQRKLCENASYYIKKSGFLDTIDGVIDVELF